MLTFSNKLFFLSLLIGCKYCIFGKLGDELNLEIWRSRSKPPNQNLPILDAFTPYSTQTFQHQIYYTDCQFLDKFAKFNAHQYFRKYDMQFLCDAGTPNP